jgi:hypothetical protein
LPEDGEVPAFAQIYVLGGNDIEEATQRQTQSRSAIDPEILLLLQNFINKNNSYAQFYRSI